jgi:O-antigen ligase
VSDRVRGGLFAGYLFACLVLGGASREGHLGNFILQACSLGLLGWGLYRLEWQCLGSAQRGLLTILGLGLVIVAVQFVPLNPGIWRALPGRETIASELELVGAWPIAGFVTLSPHNSLASITWALPAIAIGMALLAVRTLPVIAIAATVAATALMSLMLGIAQVLGGAETSAYLYDFTNRGYMVGFFANANHMATLLLVSLPFLAALIREGQMRLPERKVELAVLGASLFALIAIGIGLVGSLTGYALLGPVALASVLIIWTPGKRIFGFLFIPVLVLCAAVLVFIGDAENAFAPGDQSSLAGREQMRKTGLVAAADFFPLGSGLGTFEEVYRRYEDGGRVTRTFINHAHNDYLEIAIELGAAGLVLVALFVLWWLSCLRQLLTTEASPFAWAGWTAVGIFLTHSGWDYPLRTAALSAFFAVCCVFAGRPLSPVSAHGTDLRPSRPPLRRTTGQ